jgi:hypothetical protein
MVVALSAIVARKKRILWFMLMAVNIFDNIYYVK